MRIREDRVGSRCLSPVEARRGGGEEVRDRHSRFARPNKLINLSRYEADMEFSRLLSKLPIFVSDAYFIIITRFLKYELLGNFVLGFREGFVAVSQSLCTFKLLWALYLLLHFSF